MNIETVRKVTFVAAVAGVSLLLAGMLLGQEATSSGSSKDSATSTMSDAHFAKEAAAGGMAEVKMGQLAQEKGSNETVKSFGEKMVQDHSEANEKLKSVASEQKIELPTTLSKEDQATYDHLSSLSGDAFDKAYARDMVSDHVKDIAAFKKEAASGNNEAVKSFASETLPTLQTHLKLAHEMAQAVGVSTTTKHTSGANTNQ
jgi:putative membrane protein